MKYSFMISLCVSMCDCIFNMLNCFHYGDYEGVSHFIKLLKNHIYALEECYENEKKESESQRF